MEPALTHSNGEAAKIQREFI